MAQPASGKPSLLDLSPSTGAEEANSIRMLDALDSSSRPRVAVRRGFGWVLGALLLLVGCTASWSWWSQRAHGEESGDRIAQITAPVALDKVKAISAPASAASMAAEPAPSATIIATPQPEPMVAVAVPVSVAASTGAAAAHLPATSASQAAPTTLSAPHDSAIKPAKTKPNTATSSRDARVATQSRDERKQPTAKAGKGAATAPSSDPDVALLSAMLATMSGDARAPANAPPSAQTQLTIAQLVKRCEVRGVKDAIETFECKRRICEGYWGKADACPTTLSPKKD